MYLCGDEKYKIVLTEKERNFLKGLHRKTRVKKEADHIKVILMLDSGYTKVEIAKILMIDEGTANIWILRYQRGGIENLLDDNYTGKTLSLISEQIKDLVVGKK
jgi:transposase